MGLFVGGESNLPDGGVDCATLATARSEKAPTVVRQDGRETAPIPASTASAVASAPERLLLTRPTGKRRIKSGRSQYKLHKKENGERNKETRSLSHQKPTAFT